MGDLITIAIILIILSSAAFKLYRDKKNHVMCSGCPSCPSNGKCASQHKTASDIKKML